jgi:threonine dehydratase
VNHVNQALIEEARHRIAPIIQRTPVLTCLTFNTASGVRTFFKCENLQKGGSFKIRGASNMILSLSTADLARGVVAYSSGNHAQAVAIAARHAGASCSVVMPADAPRSKLEATCGYGATVIAYDRYRESREKITEAIQNRTGAVLVPPLDHPLIIAGHGTAALELLEQSPEIDALIAPVGSGGLLSGCAVAAKGIRPEIRVFGAEPEGANDTFLSLRAGRRVEVNPETIADGLRSRTPGELSFPILQRLVEDVILVSDDEIRAAMKFLLTRMKIVVEPSGAVAAAALLTGKLPKNLKSAAVILSGGNVDVGQLATL